MSETDTSKEAIPCDCPACQIADLEKRLTAATERAEKAEAWAKECLEEASRAYAAADSAKQLLCDLDSIEAVNEVSRVLHSRVAALEGAARELDEWIGEQAAKIDRAADEGGLPEAVEELCDAMRNGYLASFREQFRHEAALSAPPAPAVFDLITHLYRQRNFSARTFGPGARAAGVCNHIRKELSEIEAKPADITEWVDVILLALDGAWRSGAEPEEIAAAIAAKQAKNERRDWPDWRTCDPDKAIEHVRGKED